MKNDLLEWNIKELPSIHNHVHNTCVLMNKWGNSSSIVKQLLANRARKRLKKYMQNVKNIHFDHNFNILFGNLIGKSIWFTDTYILDYAPIYFGEHITIGPGCKLITSWHDLGNMDIIRAKSITIEDNCWITMNCIILAGVTIGENSVVAAGSVVTKSQPPNSLIAGNPAKVVKKIGKTNKQVIDISTRHDRKKCRIMKILDFIINDIKNKIRIFR